MDAQERAQDSARDTLNARGLGRRLPPASASFFWVGARPGEVIRVDVVLATAAAWSRSRRSHDPAWRSIGFGFLTVGLRLRLAAAPPVADGSPDR